MADVKISQLPAATTPLDGTELTPIVQSGTTKRVSVANLTVGRALTASSLTLSTPLSAANGGTGLTSLGTGIPTFLGTPTSANLAAAVTDETGTGALVFGTTPTFTTSALFPAGTVGAPGISVSGDTNTGIYFPAADTIGFATNGAASMQLDASGNLGLGVTPSAWGAGIKSLDVNTYGSFASNSVSGQTDFWNNGYFNGTNSIFKNNGFASIFRQEAGTFKWFTSTASGTAGNAISFTQAMTLTAAGNLGINSTTASLPLTIGKGGGANPAVSGSTQSAGGIARIGSAGVATLDVGTYSSGAAWMQVTNVTNLATNYDLVLQPNGGSVGIGTTSAGTLLTVNGVATLCSGTATPAGGSTSARLIFGTTAGFGIYYGSGAPTVSAAQGSIYLRSDGSSTSTRLYVNTDGSTTWTNVTTAA